jgi:D-amino-acid dehydrogenase
MSDHRCDVAVVGGGLVGSTLAYELVALGADVLLVDDHQPGRASDAGAGILSPETTWKQDDVWFRFGRAAADHYRTLVSRLAEDGGGDTGFAQCGLLLVAVDVGEDAWFASRLEMALRRSPRSLGLAEVTPDEACLLFPPLGPVRRALHNPVAARVDGRLMTAAVLHGAERRGLRRLPTTVTGLRLGPGGAVGLDCGGATVSCGALAIAGGAWSPAFERQLGVSIPVQPVKGQIIHMELPPGPDGGAVDSGGWPIVSPVLNHYLVAWPGGRVACGGTFEPEARFDIRPTVAGLDQLLRSCLAMAPGLAQASLVDVRVGLRPVSRDDLPVLGPVPGWDNVHLVTGHGAEGLLLGPYSSACVARGVLGEPVTEELRPFSLGRFID